jgi:ABC-type uncharacterized transport system auxiliary subunit
MTSFDIIDQHDDRFSRVETDVSELKADFRVLQHQLEEGFGMLSGKLDAILTIEPRVAALETKQATRDRWFHRSIKVVGSVVSAVVVAFALIHFGLKP